MERPVEIVQLKLQQGFSNLICRRSPYVFVFRNLATLQDILQRCKNIKQESLNLETIWSDWLKNSRFQSLANLFWKLATLKMVATPSLRTSELQF